MTRTMHGVSIMSSGVCRQPAFLQDDWSITRLERVTKGAKPNGGCKEKGIPGTTGNSRMRAFRFRQSKWRANGDNWHEDLPGVACGNSTYSNEYIGSKIHTTVIHQITSTSLWRMCVYVKIDNWFLTPSELWRWYQERRMPEEDL